MSHKDAPPETPEQVRMREFYRARGVVAGWGRAKDGSYLAPFARNAWAAWQEAQRSAAYGCSWVEQVDRMNKSIEAFAVRVLGQERYDNSPCQAHPLELVERFIEERKTDSPSPTPCGGWLWCKLMDWCRKRGVHPGDYNDLFAIVSEARTAKSASGITDREDA